MKKQLHKLSLSGVILASLLALNTNAQTLPTAETKADNNTSANAMPIAGSSAKVRGNIFPNGDVDFYSFTAIAGSKVYVGLMTAFSAGSSTDSQLRIYASDGTTVLEFDDDNGSNAGLSSTISGVNIPTTGTYYIQVNDFTAGTTTERGYDLYFRVESGAATAEVEGNDTPATANIISANGKMSGARNPAVATEQDWYAITLAAGESVFLSLDLDPERDGISWNGRLGLALFGDASNQILVVDDAGTGDITPNPNLPAESMYITVKDAGTYYVFVDAAGAAVGGPTATYEVIATRFAPTTGYLNYASVDVPKTIGPTNVSNTSTITIADNKIIKDLSVRVNLNHAVMTEIDAILTSPQGNQYHLFTDIGAAATGGQTQMDLFFNDNNGTPPAFTVLKGVGLMPELGSKLDQFQGMNANGTWTLTLYDDVSNANGGTLTSWSLDILEDVTASQIVGPGYTTLYSEDFETTDGAFTHSGTADEFTWGTPATLATTTANPIAAFTTANSGTKCWKTDLTGTYNLSSSQDLYSPNVTLQNTSANTFVNWSMKYQMESANFDHLNVTIEEVGGSGLTKELFVWLGATQTAAPGNPTINVPLSSPWGIHYADVSEFEGKTVRLHVHADGDNTVTFGGVAIDDVRFSKSCANTTSTLNVAACVTYTVPSGDETYTVSGTYNDTLVNSTGCDSIITINLTINQPNTGTAVISSCNAITWIDGNTYSASNNTATFVLTNAAGCDSTVALNYTRLNATTGTAVITSCNDLTWIDGNTYTSSNNTATFILTNVAGCDSTVTLNYTRLNATTGTAVITSCNDLTWIDGNTYTASNNSATFVLTNAAGCDSTVTLNYTKLAATTGTDVITSCNDLTWIDGNTYSTSNNTATFVLTNAAGCDSTVTLNYTKLSATTGTDIITSCNDLTWIDGNTYTASNNSATFVLVNAAGCDSTVSLNYTKLDATTGTDLISACGSYTWIDGNTYSTSNTTATFVLTNSAGCDSIVTLNLTITPAIDVTTNTSAETITANATSATYQWIDCNNANLPIAGETNASFTANTNGNYAVIITQGLCSDTSVCVAITSVGIRSITANNLISIQPNPNNGSFTIKAPMKGNYTLVNELGQVIKSFELNNTNNYSVSISDLATGIYFVIGTDNSFRNKIVVTK